MTPKSPNVTICMGRVLPRKRSNGHATENIFSGLFCSGFVDLLSSDTNTVSWESPRKKLFPLFPPPLANHHMAPCSPCPLPGSLWAPLLGKWRPSSLFWQPLWQGNTVPWSLPPTTGYSCSREDTFTFNTQVFSTKNHAMHRQCINISVCKKFQYIIHVCISMNKKCTDTPSSVANPLCPQLRS